ncbi:retrovirus-related pol polyprotein from transposon TNT 1-94 [Tanacetum coccineum]
MGTTKQLDTDEETDIKEFVKVLYTITKWHQSHGYDKQWQKTKNIAYNVVIKKTTYDLIKALSNMYEKPSASNKVFLIRQLVNTKMKEGASIADHVNEFNSILSWLMSVDIKFDNEVQALLLLSSLPESWEDISRKTFGEYSNSLISTKEKGRGRKQDKGQKQNRGRSKSKKRAQSKNRQDITCWNCNQKGHFQNQCLKPVASRDKEVNMAARDSDDALVCCMENTIEDRIMDSGASFHATYCKEELERIGMNMLASKGNVLDVRKVDIYFSGVTDPATMILLSNTAAGVTVGLHILEEEWQGKDTSLAHLKVFGCDSFVKVKDVYGEAMKCTFIGSDSDEMRYNFRDTKKNDSIVTKHVLSLRKTLAPGWELRYEVGGSKYRASRIVEDQMKKTLNIEHPPRIEALRLHSRKEGITKLVDVQGSDMAEFNKPKCCISKQRVDMVKKSLKKRTLIFEEEFLSKETADMLTKGGDKREVEAFRTSTGFRDN